MAASPDQAAPNIAVSWKQRVKLGESGDEGASDCGELEHLSLCTTGA
jgi:hypothetical protein